MTPFYTDNKYVTIYHGDCRAILPALAPVDLVLTDPPYGIAHPCNFGSRGRGNLAVCNNYPDVHGDNEPFDPSHVLALSAATILWGANYYANLLPSASGWLVWDKQRPHDLDQATCELAWSNFVKGARVFSHLWNGMMRASERGENFHPTQKPVALMAWCLTLQWTPPGTVLDPYCGSGPVLLACKKLARKCIGVEISEKYCEIAARRLENEPEPLFVIEEPVVEQNDLFKAIL